MRKIRIGAGAGYAGDRIEPAIELVEQGNLSYLIFECLAERTIAIAQMAKAKDPKSGFDPLLQTRFYAILKQCHEKGIKIITNMGAANPKDAALAVAEVARALGIKGLKIAALEGDNVLDSIPERAENIISANAYLGVEGIVEALAQGADIVITGRVSDPALFLAPMVYEFNWDLTNWDLLGKGTVVGHLIECSAQVTGGYFADCDMKMVPHLARIGFPIAEVYEDGSCIIEKVKGSGGLITLQTCKEQLLYEVHDPANYIQPDVVADFSAVIFKEEGFDRISVHGATGHPRPETLKVTIGYQDGFIGEGQISYCGHKAVARGHYALEIVQERFKIMGLEPSETRFELIGVNALHNESNKEPNEVRLRVIGRTETIEQATRIGNEVETLWLNGPYGGAGAWKSAREVIAASSTLISRSLIKTHLTYWEV